MLVEKIIPREILQPTPLYIWVLGPFASGKTTVCKQLQEELPGSQRLTDGSHFMDIIKEDSEQRLHRKFGDSGEEFIVTSAELDYEMHRRLVRDIKQANTNYCLIEQCTGYDPAGVRDMSLASLMRFIPDNILARSIFLYVNVPTEERFKRNEDRGWDDDSRTGDDNKVPPEVFIAFGMIDDFQHFSRPHVK